MGAEMIRESSPIFNQLKLLITREEFITFSGWESLRSEKGYMLEQKD
jgi:hypothetical protein